MKSRLVLIICFFLVAANIIVGNQLAPTGILLTPVVLGVIATIIGLTSNDISPLNKSILLSGLTILHDAGIKLYSGGTHDLEGLGFVHLFLIIGFIIAFVVLIISILREANMNWQQKLIAALLYPITLSLYLIFFYDLGLGRYYPL